MRLEIPMNEVKNVEYDGTDLNSLDFGDCRWRKPYDVVLPPHPFGTQEESIMPVYYTIQRLRPSGDSDNTHDDSQVNDSIFDVYRTQRNAVFRHGETITCPYITQDTTGTYTPVVVNLINCNPVGTGGNPSVQVSGGQPKTFTIVGSNYNIYYKVSSISSGSHTLGSNVVLTLSPKNQLSNIDNYYAERLIFYNADTNQEIGRINAEYSRQTEIDKWYYVQQNWQQNDGYGNDTFTFNYVSIHTIFGIPYVDNVKVEVNYSAEGWHTVFTGQKLRANSFWAGRYSVNSSLSYTFAPSQFGLQSFKNAKARISGWCPDAEHRLTNFVLGLNTKTTMSDFEDWVDYDEYGSNKCHNYLTFSLSGITFESVVYQMQDTVNPLNLLPNTVIQKIQQYFIDETGEYE